MQIRYSIPTRHESAPHGTIAKCILDAAIIYYIQVSFDDEQANWIPLQILFETVFIDKITDEAFMASCLLTYRQLQEETRGHNAEN